ncbi:MAG TPA: L-rhamnose/proton symporter RhaT [Terriglobales bacterium]|nr:L-rhamnose/proton symporter RhaT [Terriglobales bacterium]
METVWGALIVVLAGLVQGSGAWPMKLMRRFKFEHWWFIAMLVGLVLAPWIITLTMCPNVLDAYRSIDTSTLVKANLCALSWGVANILCGLCFVRIGIALTGGILTGLGVSVGVTVPMIVKGSGLFSEAPSLNSAAGKAVLVGVAIMLVGVVFAALAGFGRDRALRKTDQPRTGSFMGGLIMVVIAGALSAGISFAFVYSQGPIVSAMKARGAGEIPANFAVWAIGLLGGALINVTYPAYLMTKNKNWHVLWEAGRDLTFAIIMGVNFILGVALMGKGMLLLGALGASVGFGVQQAMQMLGSQGVGFASGEWRGVTGTPRKQMYLAIAILIAAALVMAYGNTLTKS